MRPTAMGGSSGVRTEIPVIDSWREPLGVYLAWMRGANRAEGTIYLHSYQLRRYAWQTKNPPWPVTLEQLAEYMASLEVGASGKRTARQALRGFYRWGELVRGESNPAANLPKITAPRGVARPAPEHSVRVGMNAASERVRLMIQLGVRVGLRCREICRVSTRDVLQDLVGWSLLVEGKGGHRRSVPLPGDLAAVIMGMPDGFLFPGQISGHLSASYVSKLISRVLPPGVTAHMLRHRYGTRAYNLGGKDLRAVQELLGHRYISTTQIYVGVDDDAVRRAALMAAAV